MTTITTVTAPAMRLYPPACGVTRQPIHDITLGGYPIAKGSTIAISTYAMHRDPKLYPDPDRFDPGRRMKPSCRAWLISPLAVGHASVAATALPCWKRD